MDVVKSKNQKVNKFSYIIDRMTDILLLFLLCVLTSHNVSVEGENYIYYLAFFSYIGIAGFRAILKSYLNLFHFKIPVQTLWYGLFIVLGLTSYLWAKYPDAAMDMISRLTQNMILSFFMIINVKTKEDFRRLQNIFILSVVYMSLRILFSVSPSELFSRHLGNYDITGHNVNFTAFYFAIILILLFYRYYVEKSRLYIALILFLGFMLILTSSRKALLMIIIGFFLIVLFDKNTKHKLLKLIIGMLIFAVFVYLIFTNEKLYRAIGWKFDSMLSFLENNKGDKSLYERKFFREYAVELFYKNPFVGVGLNNFSQYLGKVFSRATYSHNNWLEMLSCLGVVGFVMYYWFYLYCIFKSYNQLKRGYRSILPFMIIIITMFIFEYAQIVYYDTFIQLVISLCFIGVSVGDRALEMNTNKRYSVSGGNEIE